MTTSSTDHPTTSSTPSSGFTMVEMMVSITIFSIVLASILSTFVVFAQSSFSAGAYAEMSSESRKALELFSRDVRGAEQIHVVAPVSGSGEVYTATGIDLTFPAFAGAKTVKYRYSNNRFIRTQTSGGTTTVEEVLEGVRQLKLKFFQTPGSDFSSVPGPVASVDTWTKSVQLDAELLREIGRVDTTDYIISARFMLRN